MPAACGDQKRSLDLLSLVLQKKGCELLCGCWDSNPDLLQEQQVLLSPKPSLRPWSPFLGHKVSLQRLKIESLVFSHNDLQHIYASEAKQGQAGLVLGKGEIGSLGNTLFPWFGKLGQWSPVSLTFCQELTLQKGRLAIIMWVILVIVCIFQ